MNLELEPRLLAPCLELEGQGAACVWPRSPGEGDQRDPRLLVGEREEKASMGGKVMGAKTPEMGQRREGKPLLYARPTCR